MELEIKRNLIIINNLQSESQFMLSAYCSYLFSLSQFFAVCEDILFERRWFLKRHLLERYSDFCYKCFECRNSLKRRTNQLGCNVEAGDMVCFDSTGLKKFASRKKAGGNKG